MHFKNTRSVPGVITYKTIRRSIGILGMALPFVLLIGGKLVGCHIAMPSISHYYYTLLITLFTGTLCAVGLFLFSYKGYSPLDDMATNFAGLCAFGVALCPTSKPEVSLNCNIFNCEFPDYPSWLHYTFAALFFVTLALISIFLFTKTDPSLGPMTPGKKKKNVVYRICGIFMLVFIVLVPILSSGSLKTRLENYNPTFWCETGALLNFGISWLTKGI